MMTTAVEAQSALMLATRWLQTFSQAIGAADPAALSTLFHADSHWRDLIAFTGGVSTLSSGPVIVRALAERAASRKPVSFEIDARYSAPARTTRAGYEIVEVFFRFETDLARARGIVRLDPKTGEGSAPLAWTLFTEVDEFKGYETIAYAKGFLMVAATPLTRSSHHAGDDFAKLRAARAQRG